MASPPGYGLLRASERCGSLLMKMRLSSRIRSGGFTLIEMSIVLAIIGFIAGGVLVGYDLILAAQIRSAISQLARFDQAVVTFEGKYGCLPGDCSNASTLLPPPPNYLSGGSFTTLDGNANGEIDVSPGGNWYAPGLGWNNPEPSKLFASLWTVGLIGDSYNPGEGANIANNGGDVLFPVSPIRGRVSVYTNAVSLVSGDNPSYSSTADGRSYYLVGIGIRYADFDTITISTGADSPGTWTPYVARRFDLKIDDGLPMTGSVRATGGDGAWENVLYDAVPGQTGGAAAPCVNANSAYNSPSSVNACALRVRTSW